MTYIPMSPISDYRITLRDGTVIECTTELQDTLAFEGQKKKALVSSAGQVPLIGDLLWLAWHAACREGKTEHRQFARFVAQVAELEARPRATDDYEFDADDALDGAEGVSEVVGAGPTQEGQYDG